MQKKMVNAWLYTMLVMFGAMVVLGGITRLMHAGLSITEWNLVTGVIPPMSHDSWVSLFDKYKLTSEYNSLQNGMSLGEFKFIFFLEYFHRLLGRILGAAFLIPFVILFKHFSYRQKIQSIGVGITIMMQGIVGWYMVKSGLANLPYVSPYRLALHMIMAAALILSVTWMILENKYGERKIPFNRKDFHILSGFVILTMIYGALVAGYKAGLVYNEFPMMGENIIPKELGFYGAFDIFENPVSIQFLHRIFGVSTFGIMLFVPDKTSKSYITMLGLVCVQIGLGISTLILHVPFFLALMHQAVGFSVLTSVFIWGFHLKESFRKSIA
jgi:heme a synthase